VANVKKVTTNNKKIKLFISCFSFNHFKRVQCDAAKIASDIVKFFFEKPLIGMMR